MYHDLRRAIALAIPSLVSCTAVNNAHVSENVAGAPMTAGIAPAGAVSSAQGFFALVEPPAGNPARAAFSRVRARVFALGDTQLHHLYGKRTFAQSPWADRTLSFEVAVRPAALDDGSDLLLEAFLAERHAQYAEHSLVYMGDAADLSCTHELDSFFTLLADAHELPLLMVTSNHDGFYAGNFSQKADADGALVLTDMPHDWTRACSLPARRADFRLSKGLVVRRLYQALPSADDWATYYSDKGASDPNAYKQSHLAFVRPLRGDDARAPAWGVFLDTVDYAGFDLTRTRGAGTTGAVSGAQLIALERALFEALLSAQRDGAARPVWLMFGHHPIEDLESASRARLLAFWDSHPEIVAYVAAHTHRSDEKTIVLPSGRRALEIIVGSTTDAPQTARVIEVRDSPAGGEAVVLSWRLALDADKLCAGITTQPGGLTGYVAYRILRDDTPDITIDFFDKVAIGTGLGELNSRRNVQAMGALLVENDLVRSLAYLYRHAPASDSTHNAALDAILASRFRVGDDFTDLRPWLTGTRSSGPLDDYERWTDPVLAPLIPRLSRALYSFGQHVALWQALRATRHQTPARWRYFACHAARAAQAEATLPRRSDSVVYIP